MPFWIFCLTSIWTCIITGINGVPTLSNMWSWFQVGFFCIASCPTDRMFWDSWSTVWISCGFYNSFPQFFFFYICILWRKKEPLKTVLIFPSSFQIYLLRFLLTMQFSPFGNTLTISVLRPRVFPACSFLSLMLQCCWSQRHWSLDWKLTHFLTGSHERLQLDSIT